MFIILEGPDFAGKSTLAVNLARYFGAELLHKGPPVEHVLREYVPHEYPDVWPIICDRWDIGEDVYGQLLRGRSGFDEVSRWYMDAVLKKIGAIRVLCRPGKWHDGWERIRKAGGDDFVKDEATYFAIWRAYHLKADVFDIVCDPFVEGTEVCADLIIDKFTQVRDIAQPLDSFDTLVGPLHANPILLLGEKRASEEWPFAFVPMPSTSGRFMFRGLAAAGRLGEVAVANATEEDVVALVSELSPRQVVALGNVATKIAVEAGIRHGAVPHPQYVRRFHHAHCNEYARQILEAGFRREDRRSWRP